ncbi:unnamed protein product [Rotaria sp. Silwood2]|nr:unnamed protein product [Rotaria sp. Silwood2]CAF3888576.1 unnamed protein product [Rotaria sp. Silwood2]
MQPNPNRTNRLALDNTTHLNSYDPSAPYRAMMMPPPPPVNSNMPPTLNPNIPASNPYYSNPNLSQNVPPMTQDPRNANLTRIPRYYYPRYDGAYDTYVLEMRETEPYAQPPDNPQLIQNEYVPYSQPGPLPVDPYASGPYYSYSTPYVVPSTSNVPYENPDRYRQVRSNSDLITSHKKDGDLSRLEVYHFTPKQNTTLSSGVNAVPPVIQYHVYPYPPAAGPQSQSIPANQQPSYYYQQQDHQSDVSHHLSDQFQGQIPTSETKARSSQTDQPITKTRGVSPIYFSGEASINDDDGYPTIHKKEVHTDRYNIKTGRLNRRFYDNHSSSALPDCRCLDCQRERSKVLNYYPD